LSNWQKTWPLTFEDERGSHKGALVIGEGGLRLNPAPPGSGYRLWDYKQIAAFNLETTTGDLVLTLADHTEQRFRSVAGGMGPLVFECVQQRAQMARSK
jgi:hypothetical protein